jgi:hypothetical protein
MESSRPTQEELRGMTVNERLFACGLLDDYEAAAKGRDRTKMIELLMDAAASREQAEWSVDTTLSNPSKYGY